MNKVVKAYMLLRSMANEAGIGVWDTEFDGPGVTIDRKVHEKYFPAPYLISIGNFKSLKKRMFVLAHELGHCTRICESDDGEFYLKPLAKSVGESEANFMAIKILALIEDKWPDEFIKMYKDEKAKRRS